MSNQLRDEIQVAMARYSTEAAELRLRLAVLDGKIATLVDVLGTIDELAEGAEPPPVPERAFGTGRAPRRDVQGCIKQAITTHIEARGIGPTLADVVHGARILLDCEITESATRRALDGLITKGELHEHDNRYAPGRRSVPDPSMDYAAK